MRVWGTRFYLIIGTFSKSLTAVESFADKFENIFKSFPSKLFSHLVLGHGRTP